MGDEFKELRPEKDTFTTLNFDIRLLLDDGNHAGAFLMAGLTCFYIYLNQLNTQPSPSRILNEMHNYYFPCTIGLFEQTRNLSLPRIGLGSNLEGRASSRQFFDFVPFKG